MKHTILITGCNGMLGSEAAVLFREFGYDVIECKKVDFDICNLSEVQNFFSRKEISGKKIDYILHAASYTAVDNAEVEKDLAFATNAKGAQNMAIIANQCNAVLISISSDYVFDGKKNSLYEIDDEANPINVYGASKLAGEKNISASLTKYYIVRTSWLYGKNGKNFVKTMINLSKTHQEIRVVNDQFGCPTLTTDLIFALKDLIETKSQYGIYHLCGSGVVSWFELAKEIFAILQIKTSVIPISSQEYKSAALRPKYCAMKSSIKLRHWQEALYDYLKFKNTI